MPWCLFCYLTLHRIIFLALFSSPLTVSRPHGGLTPIRGLRNTHNSQILLVKGYAPYMWYQWDEAFHRPTKLQGEAADNPFDVSVSHFHTNLFPIKYLSGSLKIPIMKLAKPITTFLKVIWLRTITGFSVTTYNNTLNFHAITRSIRASYQPSHQSIWGRIPTCW